MVEDEKPPTLDYRTPDPPPPSFAEIAAGCVFTAIQVFLLFWAVIGVMMLLLMGYQYFFVR